MRSIKRQVATDFVRNAPKREGMIIPLFMIKGYLGSAYTQDVFRLISLRDIHVRNTSGKNFDASLHQLAMQTLALALQITNFKRTGPLCDLRYRTVEEKNYS